MEVRIFVFLLRLATALRKWSCCAALCAALSLTATTAIAAEDEAVGKKSLGDKDSEAPLEDEQLLTPKVKRNKIKVGKIDTENFELGPFGGLYSIEDFGSSLVVGARFAWHLSESFFVEANYGQTKGGHTSAETLLNREFFTEKDRELTYYNATFGYNVLPGEAFIGSNWAFVNALYLVAGAGNTTFGGEDRFTVVGGFGYRLLVTDWLAAHLDFKDHVFQTDFFGEEKTTHNMEIHGGFTIFF
ncbi:MAG: outer membrane beta-barrel domain-containing protein [Gammaproteobacteria bacterium]|jgi:outer membrane beta-barrel protein